MSQMKELDKTARDINEIDTSDGEVKVMIIKIQDLRVEDISETTKRWKT